MELILSCHVEKKLPLLHSRRMCGRFANGLGPEAFREAVSDVFPDDYEIDEPMEDNTYFPSYNVAPNTRYPVLCMADDPHHLRVDIMRWGLRNSDLTSHHNRPAWDHFIINARDDSIKKPSSIWRNVVQSQRCILFCQGYYEWQRSSPTSRPIPYFVGMSVNGIGRPTVQGSSRCLMPMAGVWTVSEEGENKYAVVTTHANKQLRFLHDRMPVILGDVDAIVTWLAPSTPMPDVLRLLQPYDAPLDCFKVPTEVGTVGISNENMIHPVETRKDGIVAMFTHAQKKKTDETSIKREDTSNDAEPHSSRISVQQRELPTTPSRSTQSASSPRKRSKGTSPHVTKRPKGTPSLESFWH
ncbi:DNA damage response protein [Malassezia pachydermatis]